MAKIIITAVVLLVVFAGLIVVLDNVKVNQSSPSPTITEMVTATPDYGVTGNIHVFSPVAGDEVGLPLVIKGEARTFEATFAYRIKNGKGTVLVEGHSMTTGTADYPAFRPFEVSVNYPDPKTASGSVEVFEFSAKDGSEINKVVVPVVFKKVTNAQEVKLYLDLNAPVTTRIPKTDTPVRATLDELLVRLGALFKINSVNLKSGVLTVDLNMAADVDTQAKITKTALQFSSVKSVVFTVNGKAL
ncbi:MAG: Gmad2 immunoglobulin-like domain-containing protein [Patescibacteria group bacterium]